MEIPDLEVGHRETPSPLNPLGAKGAGEAGTIPVPALLAEAIEDALAPFGVRIAEMPLSPTRVWELIEESGVRSQASGDGRPIRPAPPLRAGEGALGGRGNEGAPW
jgi:hypothetical protein